MADLDRMVLMLRHALATLAAPAAEQIEYLRGLGPVSVDELGLELDDISGAALAALKAAGRITVDGIASVEALGRELQRMSGSHNARLWTEEALVSASEWIAVRRLAAEALHAIRTL